MRARSEHTPPHPRSTRLSPSPSLTRSPLAFPTVIRPRRCRMRLARFPRTPPPGWCWLWHWVQWTTVLLIGSREVGPSVLSHRALPGRIKPPQIGSHHSARHVVRRTGQHSRVEADMGGRGGHSISEGRRGAVATVEDVLFSWTSNAFEGRGGWSWVIFGNTGHFGAAVVGWRWGPVYQQCGDFWSTDERTRSIFEPVP